jgi:hypothetical protein
MPYATPFATQLPSDELFHSNLFKTLPCYQEVSNEVFLAG